MTTQSISSQEITVICCGMRRSGSTLQTKLVKEIISYGKTNESYKILKRHDLTQGLRNLIAQSPTKLIYSYRDIRDVVVSEIRVYQMGNSFIRTACMGVVADMVQEYKNWNSYQDILVSRYEHFAFHIDEEVRRIADFLGITLKNEDVTAIAGKYSKEQQAEVCNAIQAPSDKGVFMDMNLGYLKNHIGSGETEQWRSALNPSQLAFIEYVTYDWLVQMQYPISQPASYRYFFGMIGMVFMKGSQLYRWLKKSLGIKTQIQFIGKPQAGLREIFGFRADETK